MIQGGIIPQLFHEETFPNLMNVVDIRRLAELFHNTALSSGSTFNDFKRHFDDISTGLGKQIKNIPPTYGGVDGGAASATSSAASEALAKRRVV